MNSYREIKMSIKYITIGEIVGKDAHKFEALGFEMFYHVLGQFLLMGCDENIFKMWLTCEINVSDAVANEVYRQLLVWTNANV